MKSFGSEASSTYNKRDTQIPNGEIPFILLHWLHEHYYGGGLTPLDMRKFLESKLRDTLYERSVVEVWINRAHYWRSTQDAYKPGFVDGLLEQYFHIKIVA